MRQTTVDEFIGGMKFGHTGPAIYVRTSQVEVRGVLTRWNVDYDRYVVKNGYGQAISTYGSEPVVTLNIGGVSVDCSPDDVLVVEE